MGEPIADALIAYVRAEIEYQVSSALSSHEFGYHDSDESSCRAERDARDAAEKALRAAVGSE